MTNLWITLALLHVWSAVAVAIDDITAKKELQGQDVFHLAGQITAKDIVQSSNIFFVRFSTMTPFNATSVSLIVDREKYNLTAGDQIVFSAEPAGTFYDPHRLMASNISVVSRNTAIHPILVGSDSQGGRMPD